MLIIAAEMHFYHNYSHFTPFIKDASKQNLRVTLFIVKATSRFASIGRGGHFWHLVLTYTGFGSRLIAMLLSYDDLIRLICPILASHNLNNHK